MNGQEQAVSDQQIARIAILETQQSEREKAIEKALNAAQKAVDKAENQLMARLEGFPQTYLGRDEYTREHQHLIDQIEDVSKTRHMYITADKYEDKLAAEKLAREAALLRVDEKFQDYVKRYEQRQREVDLLLSAAKGAADQQARASEKQQYQTNRNIAILAVVLTAVIVLMNLVGIG